MLRSCEAFWTFLVGSLGWDLNTSTVATRYILILVWWKLCRRSNADRCIVSTRAESICRLCGWCRHSRPESGHLLGEYTAPQKARALPNPSQMLDCQFLEMYKHLIWLASAGSQPADPSQWSEHCPNTSLDGTRRPPVLAMEA